MGQGVVTVSCAAAEAAYDGGTEHLPTLTMEHDFLSIKQASERYVVSDVTLRRLAREITREDRDEFREYIRPGAAELKQLKEEGRPFEYELSTKLLNLRYKERNAKAEEGNSSSGAKKDETNASTSIPDPAFELFREQLKVKDEQIRQLNESLRAMQQQQNGTNMLLVRLSERLPLLSEPVPLESKSEATVESQTVQNEEPAPAKTVAAKKKTAQKRTKTKPKKPQSRGVFRRWFRSPTKAGAAQ